MNPPEILRGYFVARPDDSETERMSCFRWPFGHRRRTKS